MESRPVTWGDPDYGGYSSLVHNTADQTFILHEIGNS